MAVVGAATAGSEIARILAERGALVIVFEQNPRPYGKIEDGLPRWHVKQRKDEYEEINKRLDHPNIEYVPMTRMGRELDFDELRTAMGTQRHRADAWRVADRAFPVEGADHFIDSGLVYQNKLIYWFNHYLEKNLQRPALRSDSRRDRRRRRTRVDRRGQSAANRDDARGAEGARHRGRHARARARRNRAGAECDGLKYGDLGVAPCKLYYRRRVLDMPLSDIPPDAPAKRADALKMARAKILEKAQRKFLFEFQELRAPSGRDRRKRLYGRREFQPHRSCGWASADRARGRGVRARAS